MSTNFLYSKVCWQHPAMFCLYSSPAHNLNFYWRWWDSFQAIFFVYFIYWHFSPKSWLNQLSSFNPNRSWICGRSGLHPVISWNWDQTSQDLQNRCRNKNIPVKIKYQKYTWDDFVRSNKMQSQIIQKI